MDDKNLEALWVDGRQSETALMVQRGVMRFFASQLGYATHSEVSLANNRRADLLAIGPKGEIIIVEIKSSKQDFMVDKKWPEYLDFCDQFYFAKPIDLDEALFPADVGLIVADGHGADILRPAQSQKLAPARRKAVTLLLARLGAQRLHGFMDPGISSL